MKNTIAVLVATMAVVVLADTDIVDGVTWSYTKNGGNATVTGATPCVGEMSMPATLGGATVTSIGTSAFCAKTEITKMSLPECIKTIGMQAFQECHALTSINIPNGVTTIGFCTFSFCSSLAKVELPDTVTDIGRYAFQGCSNLETLQLSSRLITIDDYAFSGCSNLKEINIPESVMTVGSQAFYKCRSLISLSIPSGTSSIAESAFVGCSGLKSISVGVGNTCVKIANGCLVSLAGTALYAAPSGNESVTLPEGIISIPGDMFCDAGSMKRIALPSSLMTIGGWAFGYCTSLEEIEFPESFVSFVGSYTFYCCNNIKRTIFNGVPPSGLSNYANLDFLTRGMLSYPREYGAEWQNAISLSTFSGYTQNDCPEVEYVSVAVRESDPTILDVVYRVKSTKPTVKVRALAFKDGVRSFANVVRPETFIEETEVNVGDAISANAEHKLTWRVSSDWQIDLAKVKFEVLAVEEDLLPLELVTIPANGANKAMEISWNAINSAQVFDALLWLYADKTAGLTLADGVLKDGSAQIASGTSITATEAVLYVFSKMGFSLLSGDTLTYANAMTRLGLSPSGLRQYAYRWIEAE